MIEKKEYRILNNKFLVGISWECFVDPEPKDGDEIQFFSHVFDVKKIRYENEQMVLTPLNVCEVFYNMRQWEGVVDQVKTEIYTKTPF